jgi:CheY-like chemotaxis protein
MTRSRESLILVVEDQADDRALIEMALRENGVTCPIQLVNNGEEAIRYMMGEGKYADRAQYPYPSFTLTDLKMPEGDGFMVLEHLQANPEWAIIPTVVLTSSEDPDDIKQAYSLGASSYHVKPNGFQALCLQLKGLRDFWLGCAVPEVDVTGKRLGTERIGKLGARYAQGGNSVQTRVQRLSS